MTKNELFDRIVKILKDSFEIEPARITPQARLYDDLDIDSIDAVDLIVQLKPLLGRNLQPEAFKAVRTVQDIVDVVHGLLPVKQPPDGCRRTLTMVRVRVAAFALLSLAYPLVVYLSLGRSSRAGCRCCCSGWPRCARSPPASRCGGWPPSAPGCWRWWPPPSTRPCR